MRLFRRTIENCHIYSTQMIVILSEDWTLRPRRKVQPQSKDPYQLIRSW